MFPSLRIFAPQQRVSVHVQASGPPDCLRYVSCTRPHHVDVVAPANSHPQQDPSLLRRIAGRYDAQSKGYERLSELPPTAPGRPESSYLELSIVLERRSAAATLSGMICHIQRLGEARMRDAGGALEEGWLAWDGEIEVGSCQCPSFRVGPLVVSVSQRSTLVLLGTALILSLGSSCRRSHIKTCGTLS